MIRELGYVIVVLFILGIYFITIGPVVSVLDGVMTSPTLQAQDKVGGSLLSWLPYLFFWVLPALVLLVTVVYAYTRASKKEGIVRGGRR